MVRRSTSLTGRRFIGCLLVLAAFMGSLPQRAVAAKVDDLDTSLKLIPASASFYSTHLHLGERCQAIVNSRALARLKEMPVVQMGLMLYQLQTMSPDSVPAKIQAVLGDPDSRKTVDFLRSLMAEECFVYADDSVVTMLDVFQRAIGATRYGPMLQQLSGEASDKPTAQLNLLLSSLGEDVDKLGVPNLVFGFKVGDKAAAVEQIKGLEELVLQVLDEAQPKWKSRLKRTKIGEVEYLTFKIDGKMIPWSEITPAIKDALEDEEELADKLIARLKKQVLTIAIGVRDKYLLVSLGVSTDALAKLDQGPRLAGRSEFKPLEKFADRRFTSISYMSQAVHTRMVNSAKDLDDLKKSLDELIPELPLAKDQQKQISKDVAALLKDLEKLMTTPGPVMTFSFTSPQGDEAYQYDWTPYQGLDGSRPLDILSHVGGDPLLAVVGRSKPVTVENYDLLVKWVGVGQRYFEEYALPTMGDEEHTKYDKFMKGFKPLARRIDKANRTMLIPAMADGQYGFVLDAKLQSKQLVEAMPAADKPFPVPEPALVLGVKDASLLRKGGEEYRTAINGILKLAREQSDSEMPEMVIPKPKVAKLGESEMYSFDLPADWGLDKAIEPNIGLSDKLLVLSVTRKHTERLMAATPLKTTGVLGDPKRSRAMAVHFDWAATVDAITPWADLATEQILDQTGKADDDSAKQQRKAIVSQVHTVLDVLKVLQRVTSESYLEDGSLVTHTVTEWKDVAGKERKASKKTKGKGK